MLAGVTTARQTEERATGKGSARRTMRADAVRNRVGILIAAASALVEHGCVIDMREIARRSGVGVGTLYRHFPTKEDLLKTVLLEHFRCWSEAAAKAAADTADPWVALEDFFEHALAGQCGHRAMVEHCTDAVCGPDTECIQLLHPVLENLITRNHARGVLRPGVTASDLALLLVSMSHTAELTRRLQPDSPQMWRRLMRATLDGLRTEHEASRLPDGGAAS